MPIAARLTFEMEGPEFEEGIPVLKLTNALRHFHSAVDKGYISILGKQRITRLDRSFYRLNATSISTGSLHSAIDIIVPASQLPFTFVAGIAPSQVWEVAKNAFGFLRAVASLRRDGKEPKIEISKSADPLNLFVIGSNNRVEVNRVVYNAAGQAEQHIKSLASLVDGEHISSLSALDAKKEGIELHPADNDLFNPTTVLDDNPQDLSAKIFRLDVQSRSGRLRLIGAPDYAEYPFHITGRQALHPYVLALEEDRTDFRVLREIVRHPTGSEVVHSFHIIGIIGK